jgi:DNA repair protein RecN (Recombination protein N)
MVGQRLRSLAASTQVLCVTHLAQVAAQAGQQVRVRKHVAAGHTRTTLEVLDDEARVDELARMLGGARITDRTREHAREMLAAAQRPAASTTGRVSSSSRGKGSSGAGSARAGSGNGR